MASDKNSCSRISSKKIEQNIFYFLTETLPLDKIECVIFTTTITILNLESVVTQINRCIQSRYHSEWNVHNRCYFIVFLPSFLAELHLEINQRQDFYSIWLCMYCAILHNILVVFDLIIYLIFML